MIKASKSQQQQPGIKAPNRMTSLYSLAIAFLISCLECSADLDKWQYNYKGHSLKHVAVNYKTVYAIGSFNNLHALEETGWRLFFNNVLHAAINDDWGLWVITTDKNIYFRQGLSSTNFIGTANVHVSGLLTTIATGRKGLVFASNHYNNIFRRTGISYSNPQGVDWPLLAGGNVIDTACARRVCFCISTGGALWTSEQLSNSYSPAFPSQWTNKQEKVKDISAHGENTLWKIDPSGHAWESVTPMDPHMIKTRWVRRGYQAEKFKSIAVTEDNAFALSEDGRLHVRLGCPIFDFEDDDISKWTKTGTAFDVQPVVSHTWSSGMKVLGKVGERMIDTYSKRKYDSQPKDSSMMVGDTPQGTLTSPVFQIRSKYLHFMLGGGSHPNNYVALIVGGSQVRSRTANSRTQGSAYGESAMSNFWWGVSRYLNKCAQLRIVDTSSSAWGYTLFDDLRASPPCFRGMKAILTPSDHSLRIGQQITEIIKLKGFSTSKLRPLTITISLPVVQAIPLVYIESVEITGRHCQSSLNVSKDFSGKNERRFKVTVQLTDLLFDAVFQMVARVNDHDALQSPADNISSNMQINVNYADEFIQRTKKRVTVTRHGNEAAKLDAKSWITDSRNYVIGETVKLTVEIRHNLTNSLQRAFNINIKLYAPSYMTWKATRGLNAGNGETFHMSDISEHVVNIPQLLRGYTKTITFDLSIAGDTKWNRKPKEMMIGDVILDVTYCQRNNCRNHDNSDVEVTWLIKSESLSFNFSYNEMETNKLKAFTAIVDKTGSYVFVCGKYNSHNPNCYFKNMTSSIWRGLGTILTNITWNDSANKVLYGSNQDGKFMKLSGWGFQDKEMLGAEDKNALFASSAQFDKAVNFLAPLNNNLQFDKNITISDGKGGKYAISSDGINSLLSGVASWKPQLKWRCCS